MTNKQLNDEIENTPPITTPEIRVWMTIFGCLDNLRDLTARRKAGKITNESFYKESNETLVGLAEVADITHRFGVLLPSTLEPNYRRRIQQLKDNFIRVEFSPSFWRWYNWWDDYIRTLSPDQIKHIRRITTEECLGAEDYRPTGEWYGYRSDASLVVS